jgi:hypothetical protein
LRHVDAEQRVEVHRSRAQRLPILGVAQHRGELS